MKIGDPMEEDTVVGATISKEQADKVFSYLDIAQKEVRRVHTAGVASASLLVLHGKRLRSAH